MPALTVSGIGCVVEKNHNNEMHVSVVVKGGAAHQSGIQEVLPCPRLCSLFRSSGTKSDISAQHRCAGAMHAHM